MIPITPEQYTAIGRVAVQSGVLDREIEEYLVRLGYPRTQEPLGPKLNRLRSALPAQISAKAELSEFFSAVDLVTKLVLKRNAVMHGVWSRVGPSGISPAVATHRKATVSAREVAELAQDLRNARMLLLRLCNEYCQVMDGGNKCPHSIAALKARLVSASGR